MLLSAALNPCQRDSEEYRRFGSFSRHLRQIVEVLAIFGSTGAVARLGIESRLNRLVGCSSSTGGGRQRW